MEENERYFVIPVNNRYAVFMFKPYWHMTSILDKFDIPYEIYENKESVKPYKTLDNDRQKAFYYHLLVDDKEIPRGFYFTSNIIDKVLNFYNIKYEKLDKGW